MAEPTRNIYQEQKRMRPVIAAIQRIFTDEAYRKAFSFLAATAVENAKGQPISLKIDLKSPTDSRVSHSHTIMVTPSLFDEGQREAYLRREANKLAKAMRYRRQMAKNNKAAGLVGFDEIPGGSVSDIPDDIPRDGHEEA